MKLSERLRRLPATLRRESQGEPVYMAYWLAMRLYYRFGRRFLQAGVGRLPARPRGKVAVVMPSHRKDCENLRVCLRHMRRYLVDEVSTVYVPVPARHLELFHEKFEGEAVTIIDEDAWLPAPREELHTTGWILQQMLKLNAANIIPEEYYITLDSDTLLLKPRSYFRGERQVLHYLDAYETHYNASIRRCTGRKHRFPVSFVCHSMLFDGEVVRALLAHMEAITGRLWWELLLEGEIGAGKAWFTEFDTYANFLLSQPRFRKRCVLRHWGGVDRYVVPGFDTAGADLAPFEGYSSVSFHGQITFSNNTGRVFTTNAP